MNAPRRRDAGSLPMAMLLTLVGMTLSVLLLSIVVRQLGATRHAIARSEALNAAQSGLDAALGAIRSARFTDATHADGAGDWSGLPCQLDGAVGGATYQVEIYYLRSNPHGHDLAWAQHERVPCHTDTAHFALITSAGTAGSAGTAALGGSVRTLQATYTLTTSAGLPVPGGHIFMTDAPELCFDTGSATQSVGALVTLQTCRADLPAQQRFAYLPNLSIALVASVDPSSAHPLDLCLQAGDPQAAGNKVTVQWCSDTAYPPQQWRLKDIFDLRGSDDSGPNRWCVMPSGGPRLNSTLELADLDEHDPDSPPPATCYTYLRDATVGAGRAGLVAPASSAVAGQRQIVNVGQLGRCIDVQRWNVHNLLHVWPCNQAPDLATVAWNQRWTMPEPPFDQGNAVGQISTVPDGKPRTTAEDGERWCLSSLLVPGSHVRMAPCGPDPDMSWSRVGRNGGLATSYLIMDSAGNCLSPTDPAVEHSSQSDLVGVLVVAQCDGSMGQKWNADPFILDGLPLADLLED